MSYFLLKFSKELFITVQAEKDSLVNPKTKFIEVTAPKRNDEKYFINTDALIYFKELKEDELEPKGRQW
jgi:hypothetical protein